MRNFIKSSFFILSLSLFAGCDEFATVIEVDIPDSPSLLSIGSKLEPTKPIVFSLSESTDILSDRNYKFYSNVEAKLYVDNVFKESAVAIDSQYFQFNEIPQLGHTYKVNIQDKGKSRSLVCETTLPQELVDIKILSKKKVVFTGNFNEGDTAIELDIELMDKEPGRRNFYILVYKSYYAGTAIPLTYTSSSPILTNGQVKDPFDNSNEETVYNFAYLNDDLFDGKTTQIKIKGYNFSNADSTVIDLVSLDKGLYDYYITKGIQNQTNGDPFGTPINVKSNVNGGYGVWGFSIGKTKRI